MQREVVEGAALHLQLKNLTVARLTLSQDPSTFITTFLKGLLEDLTLFAWQNPCHQVICI